MAVRQYVGARYVPKFAEPIAWQEGTSYEAMTIVLYNNSSYTSKVPVPATVGTPANNSEYWALTGNYNAQVEEYRKEVEGLKNTDDNLGYVSVLDYGAVADGKTDSTSAFTKALATGKIVRIPSGDYVIGTVAIPDYGCIIGDDGARLKLKDGANAPMFTNKNQADGHDILICGLIIDGNHSGQSAPTNATELEKSVLTFYNGIRITIERVNIDGGITAGIYFNGGSNINLTNCKVTNSEYDSGIILTSLSPMDSYVNGCISNENTKDGFTLTGQRIVATGCVACDNGKMRHDPSKKEPSCGFYLDGQSNNCTIDGCIAYHNTFAGIELSHAEHICVTNCQVLSNNAIGIYCHSRNSNISGNIVVDNALFDQTAEDSTASDNYGSIYIGSSGSTSGDVFFNCVCDNFCNHSGEPRKHGIVIEQGVNNVLNNFVSGTSLERVYDKTGESNTLNYDSENKLNSRTLSLTGGLTVNGKLTGTLEVDLPRTQYSDTEGSIYAGDTALYIRANGSWHYINYAN